MRIGQPMGPPVVPVPAPDRVDPGLLARVAPYRAAALRRVLMDVNGGDQGQLRKMVTTPLPTPVEVQDCLDREDFLAANRRPWQGFRYMARSRDAVDVLRAIGLDVWEFAWVADWFGVTATSADDQVAMVVDLVHDGWTMAHAEDAVGWAEMTLAQAHAWSSAGYTHADLILAFEAGLTRAEVLDLAARRAFDAEVMEGFLALRDHRCPRSQWGR